MDDRDIDELSTSGAGFPLSKYQQLRSLAEAATPGPWVRSGPGPEPDGDQIWLTRKNGQFIAWVDASLPSIADFDYLAAANPQTILELLDELDSWIERANRYHRKRNAAEQRVAALEEGLRKLLSWMEPMDGMVDDERPRPTVEISQQLWHHEIRPVIEKARALLAAGKEERDG